MQNGFAMAFLVVAFVAGGMIAAAAYFAIVFGVLRWLDGIHNASALGSDVGTVASVAGSAIGAALALGLGWKRFKRDDGSPDWAARVLGLVVSALLVLFWWVPLALPAFYAVASYNAVGLVAAAGFLLAGERIDKLLLPRFKR